MQLVPEGQYGPPPPLEGWGNVPTLAPPHSPLERPISAVRRYKWMIVVVLLLSTAGGVVSTRFVKPEYESKATLWIESQTPQGGGGPIRSRELLNPGAWVELYKSFKIFDNVVRKLALYIKPVKDSDAPLLATLSIGDKFLPGTYTFRVEKKTKRWRLTVEDQQIADSGSVGDSIGRAMGLRWMPEPKALARVADRDVKFVVDRPRETSLDLLTRFTAAMPLKSNFMQVTLTDQDPRNAARVLNALNQEYVVTAGDLKKSSLTEFSKILSRQLDFAETSLREAESALENFKIQTITLPSEGGPITPGVAESRLTVMNAYFQKKIEADNLKHDREALEKAIASLEGSTLMSESMLMIPSVAIGPGGEQLRQHFAQLYQKRKDLAALRVNYTDNYPAVRDLIGEIETLEKKTIPTTANSLLQQLKEREADYSSRIGSASTDLQAIPARTIEEMRLHRTVVVAEGLYQTLKTRYAEATLEEASSIPDVKVLDSAVTPQRPSKNTAPRVLAGAVVGGIALAIGLAILLDTLDKRIRYPDQAAKDLGLTISGAVPELLKGSAQSQTPEQITQLIESFRTLRMNVKHSSGQQVSLAVSSPSPGDGKSFIASNLAMSFADAGYRTLLVDGDTRRGALHEMFGLPRTVGLTDFLSGDAEQRAIIHPTGHENLFLVPTGTMRRRSPELLTSPALQHLVNDLRRQYDVLIFDTPPFAAGVDGYAIAAATGSLLVVLRIGQTERRMAAAKLLLVDRLPINIVGTVLNAAPSKGEYEYYGYVTGYDVEEELEPSQQIAEVSS
ncbi:MAG TPA: polysaccharide biosynthesis tyrosine autokinase [Gemmatimonadaceae bacterium]